MKLFTLAVLAGNILQGAMLVHRPSVLTPPHPLLPTGRNILHLWGEKERIQQYGVQNEHKQNIILQREKIKSLTYSYYK